MKPKWNYLFACFLVSIIAAVFSSGCATSRMAVAPGAPALNWPPAPAPARIRYEGSYDGVEALGARPPLWRKIINFLTSDDRGRERFLKPLALAADEQGNLCIADHGAGRVFFYDYKARRSWLWARAGKQELAAPVAVAKKGDVVYVADTVLEKIFAFTPKGKLLFEISEGIRRPAGLAISGDRLIVADAVLHRIVVYSLTGDFLYWFGDRGAGPGQLNYPTHAVADRAGLIYVTDSMNSRIQAFTSVGELVQVIGKAGDTSGHFNRPKGVALDSESNVYVADAIFDNIQIFSKSGQFLLSLGSAGSDFGEFWMPSGVAISSDGLMYVADSYNKRIQAFRILKREELEGAE